MIPLKTEKYVPHRGLWMKSTEIPGVRKEIKAKIQKLEYRDIRRAKLPLQEALMKELYEDNCIKFANYFQKILDKEKSMYSNKIIKKKMDENQELEITLVDNFRNADISLRVNENIKQSLTITLQTAQFIELNYPDYKWLSKACFEVALNLLLEQNDVSNNEQEALIRYFYGRFCLEKLFSYTSAIEQLEIAVRMSKGTIWLTDEEHSSVYLHKSSCYYLGKSYLAEANQIYEINLSEALKLTEAGMVSLTECNSIGGGKRDRNLYIEMCLRRCQYLIRDQQYEKTLKVHLKIQSSIYASENPLCKCELFLQQGICHLRLGNLPLALRKLNHAINLSETHDFTYFKGLILVEIANIYSKNNETFDLAEESLTEAKKTFQLLKDMKNLKKVNYFSAILKTQQILPRYIKLMKDADHSSCDMLKLRGWKSFLKPFWSQGNDDDDEEKVFYKCIFKEMKYVENKKF